MFIARIKDNSSGREYCNLYRGEYARFISDTFSPDIEYQLLRLKLSGKTYAERKNAARQLAIEYQTMDCGGLSILELSIIQSYFETIGARYGLITEYRENAII